MRPGLNFLTGLTAVTLGAVLILWITPAQTVPALFASVPSSFYPNFTSGMLIVSGLALAVSGLINQTVADTQTPASHIAVRFASALVLLVAAMLAAPIAGFVPTGVVICFATLLLMRERRWLLMAVISISAPLLIWACFEILLERPLP